VTTDAKNPYRYFNHLVGAGENQGRHVKARRLRKSCQRSHRALAAHVEAARNAAD
jgi:hypothetical protein